MVVSSWSVKLAHLRILLIVALIASAVFAAWSWMRPYSWNVDPGACGKIEGAQVKRDLSNYWLDLRIEVAEGKTHDLMKPVRLVTSGGKELEAADTTLGGDDQKQIREIWLKFWLEAEDFKGPLKLRINDGWLEVRSGSGPPSVDGSNVSFFPTQNW